MRKIHRWVGLLLALQVIAWMASGLYFSIFPIEEIRGEHLTREPVTLAAIDSANTAVVAKLHRALDGHLDTPWSLAAASLTVVEDEALWKVSGTVGSETFSRLVTSDGQVVPPLTQVQAERRASWWLTTEATPADTQWIEPGGGGTEFRGREMAAWRVDFEGSEPVSLYIDPWTGDLLARRTARWRLFDFFWMLHVMDYETRDDFNHPLLQVAAALGLLIALSGVAYWFMTSPLFRRRKGRNGTIN
jgi:uncharacterized iron-regulated membrane protein